MNEMIAFDEVSFKYEAQVILEEVTLSIEKGDFVAVMGPNGAGKSTFLKLVLGLLEPVSGSILLFGEPIKKFKDWKRLGYLSQQGVGKGATFPANCQEVVLANLYQELGPFHWPKKMHKEKVRKALEEVGMGGYEKRMIGQLSGGQQQRVMLAHVLVSEPEIIILDEPTNGVDQEAIDSFYQLLKVLNEEKGITIIMVTHETHKSKLFTNRQFYLEDKKLVEVQGNGDI